MTISASLPTRSPSASAASATRSASAGLLDGAPVAVVAAIIVPLAVRGRFRQGTEVFLLIPVVLIGAWLAFSLGGLVEQRLLAGEQPARLALAELLMSKHKSKDAKAQLLAAIAVPLYFRRRTHGG